MLMVFTCFLMFPPFVGSSPLYEDFLQYEEYDPNGWIVVVNSTYIYANLDIDGDGYVYWDSSETDFFQDFTHEVSARAESHISNCEGAVWLVSETVDDVRYARLNGYTQLYVMIHYHVDYDGYRMILYETYQEVRYTLDYCDIIENVTYYLSINKLGVNAECKIYNNSAKTSLVDTLSGILHDDHSFRYVYGICSQNDNTAGRNIELHVTNLDLHLITYFVTFFHNVGGILKVNGTTTSNETQIEYLNQTVIELGSLPQNSSYVFLKFLWDDGNSTTNPSNFMVTKNNTIWTYFEEIVEVPIDGVGAGGVPPRPRISLIALVEIVTIPLWTMWIEKRITLEGIYSIIFIIGVASIIRFAYRWLFKGQKGRKFKFRIKKTIDL